MINKIRKNSFFIAAIFTIGLITAGNAYFILSENFLAFMAGFLFLILAAIFGGEIFLESMNT